MKIRFLGAAKTVTGSCHVVQTDQVTFAIDCGLFQGNKQLKERNYKDFEIDPKSIDFLILTHAHIDHSGLIPKLCRLGFTGPIYCNSATAALCKVLLPDSGHIQESEIERKNRKLGRAGQVLLEPIYTVDDALNSLSQFRPVNYDEVIRVAPDVEIRLRDAGHILGSSIVETWVEEDNQKSKIVFSGDLGQGKQPIIKDPTIIESADYVVMESTYGNRYHKGISDRVEQLKNVIKETMNKGGNLIIPAFAVERTQDLLYDLNILYQSGELDKSIDIYIDSPLAIAATEIFQNSPEYFDDATRKFVAEGNHPLKLPNLKYSRSQEESMELNKVNGNTIIISASGMCDAGRIKHHLKHNLWKPESTVLFVGYQAQGSLGRRILDGDELVTIHGEKVAVRSDIRRIEAYSAHADRGMLMNWLGQMDSAPQTVFLVHGEEENQTELASGIQSELGLKVMIPDWLDEVDLKAVTEKTLAVAVQHRNIEQSIKAEELYLNLRGRLHELYAEANRTQNYEAFINAVNEIDHLL
ncbi:MAG: MBL fold metallo-hydrolase [Bacillota bacterium]|nr:MBL fold metallo-hydrolase [Bacillota bacterium]